MAIIRQPIQLLFEGGLEAVSYGPPVTPERNLVVALLRSAVRDMIPPMRYCGEKHKIVCLERRALAERWLCTTDQDHPFSFELCSNAIDREPSSFRKSILAYVDEETKRIVSRGKHSPASTQRRIL